jgi:hypothetical protein
MHAPRRFLSLANLTTAYVLTVRQTRALRQASINQNNPISLMSNFSGGGRGGGGGSAGDNVRNVANRWLSGLGVGAG